MKKSLLKIAMITVLLFSINLIAQAAPTPTTPGVKLICSGGTFKLDAVASGTTWEVRYSATQTPTPTTGVALAADGLTINVPLETGYYYIYSKSTATGCISEAQEIPFYVFKPLTASIAGVSAYCIENANTSTAELTATVTNTDDYVTLAYQWYTVDGSNAETPIALATGLTYTPTENTAGTTTTYKFKVGYLVSGNKFCPGEMTKTVTVTTPPTKPTITISNTPATW
jgi:hypothetical protein